MSNKSVHKKKYRVAVQVFNTEFSALLETMSLPRPPQPVDSLSTSQDLLVSKVSMAIIRIIH